MNIRLALIELTDGNPNTIYSILKIRAHMPNHRHKENTQLIVAGIMQSRWKWARRYDNIALHCGTAAW